MAITAKIVKVQNINIKNGYYKLIFLKYVL